jgi:hypothetical protein
VTENRLISSTVDGLNIVLNEKEEQIQNLISEVGILHKKQYELCEVNEKQQNKILLKNTRIKVLKKQLDVIKGSKSYRLLEILRKPLKIFR